MNDGNTVNTIVIFGASGDLTSRKLIPALYSLYCRQRLPMQLRVVGFARRPYSHDDFRGMMRDAVQKSDGFDEQSWDAFAANLYYARGDLNTPEDYDKPPSFPVRNREAECQPTVLSGDCPQLL
ncbi:MAG: hypothetical protein U0521_19495 [Anaerolineae bacterium]